MKADPLRPRLDLRLGGGCLNAAAVGGKPAECYTFKPMGKCCKCPTTMCNACRCGAVVGNNGVKTGGEEASLPHCLSVASGVLSRRGSGFRGKGDLEIFP